VIGSQIIAVKFTLKILTRLHDKCYWTLTGSTTMANSNQFKLILKIFQNSRVQYFKLTIIECYLISTLSLTLWTKTSKINENMLSILNNLMLIWYIILIVMTLVIWYRSERLNRILILMMIVIVIIIEFRNLYVCSGITFIMIYFIKN